MKVVVVVEAALVAALAVFGVRLASEARALDRKSDVMKSQVSSNWGIVLQSVTGIDVSGHLVGDVIPPGTKRFVVFGLRGATLQQDLNFWISAAALLAKDGGIHFVGFCDDEPCADGVRHLAQPLSFPVIAYGEASGSQAVINADAEGNCILLSGGLATAGKVSWRRPDMNPSTLALLVAQ
jgi:hypothetical protein